MRSLIFTVTAILGAGILYRSQISRSRFSEPSARNQAGWCKPDPASRLRPDDPDAGWVNTYLAPEWNELPGHPRNGYYRRFNNLGFRELADTAVVAPADTYRVLVSGDSHMEGLVDAEETFANRLEALWSTRSGRRIEVLSGGSAFYSFKNYVGYLKKYRFLKPRHYVVVVYTGNDFLEGIKEEHCGKNPWGSDAYRRTLEGALAVMPDRQGVFWQALNQIYLLRNPKAFEEALAISRRYLAELKRLADAEGIALFVVLLPTKLDVEPQTVADETDRAAGKLGLGPSDLGVNRRITQALAQSLAENKIAYLDAYEGMRGDSAELFWRYDYHLSSAGHAKLAELVLGAFAAKINWTETARGLHTGYRPPDGRPGS